MNLVFNDRFRVADDKTVINISSPRPPISWSCSTHRPRLAKPTQPNRNASKYGVQRITCVSDVAKSLSNSTNSWCRIRISDTSFLQNNLPACVAHDRIFVFFGDGWMVVHFAFVHESPVIVAVSDAVG